MSSWLITGGCGFIGLNLIRALLSGGVTDIRIVDNLSVGTVEDLESVTRFTKIEAKDEISEGPAGVELLVADIRDYEVAIQAGRGIDVIVHLAANTGVGPSVENPIMDCSVNVSGTLNFLESARENKIKAFVFASSGAPAGEVEPPIHENIVPKPVSPYGASKLAGEGYCSSYFRTFKVSTIALRFGNVYGPGSKRKSSAVAKFIGSALNDQALEIYGNGSQTRDFIYIDDLIGAIITSASTPDIGGEIFQIATSMETSVSDIVDLVSERLVHYGVKQPEVIFSESRLGDVARNYSDTSKAERMLGWKAETELSTGIDKTIEYWLDTKLEK